MKTPHRTILLAAVVAMLVSLFSSPAAADPDSPTVRGSGVASLLKQKMVQYQRAGKQIDVVAFAPGGRWVLVADDWRYYSSLSYFVNNGLRSKLDQYLSSGLQIDALAFTPNGRWVLVAGNHQWYSSMSTFNASGLRPTLRWLRSLHKRISSIAIGENNSWVVVANGRGYISTNAPSALRKTIADCHYAPRSIKHVMLQGRQWALLADHWHATSDGFAGKPTLDALRAQNYSLDKAAMSSFGGWAVVSEGAYEPLHLGAAHYAGMLETTLDPDDGYDDGRESPEATIWSRMGYHRTPGVSIAVYRNGERHWSRGYGTLEQGRNRPVYTDSVFPVASLSKAVTSAVALQLAERGQLDLDTHLLAEAEQAPNSAFQDWVVQTSKIYHDPKYYNTEGHYVASISPRQILRHMAGLNVHGIGRTDRDSLPTLRQLLFGQHPADNDPVGLHWSPGTAWAYSGGGYTVLEALLAARMHAPLAELAQTQIFSPLAMNRTPVDWPVGLEGDVAVGHSADKTPHDELLECPGKAAGGLFTTPTEFGRFVDALAHDGDSPYGRILTKDSVKEMMTLGSVTSRGRCWDDNGCDSGEECAFLGYFTRGSAGSCITLPGNAEDDTDDDLTNNTPQRYGLGVRLSKSRDPNHFPKQFWHGGTHNGYKSYFLASRDRKLVLVVTTNGKDCEDDDECFRGSRPLIKEIRESFKRVYRW